MLCGRHNVTGLTAPFVLLRMPRFLLVIVAGSRFDPVRFHQFVCLIRDRDWRGRVCQKFRSCDKSIYYIYSAPSWLADKDVYVQKLSYYTY